MRPEKARKVSYIALSAAWILGASVSPGYAQEQSAPVSQQTPQTRKAVAVQSRPEHVSNTQTPSAQTASDESTSIDFLIPSPRQKTPLSRIQKQEGIVIVISESCTQAGTTGSPASICSKVFSDQSSSETSLIQKSSPSESRQLTTIREWDARHELYSVKSIYQGTQYTDTGKTRKEFEFFEITREQPASNRVKEVLIYDYYAESGKIKKMTWAKYEKSPDQSDETLTAHAYLTYNESGAPNQGITESVENGSLTAEFLNWNESEGPASEHIHQSWKGWENWIASRQLSAYVGG